MRTPPLPQIVRCMSNARPMPKANSTATEMTVITSVTTSARHQKPEVSTVA